MLLLLMFVGTCFGQSGNKFFEYQNNQPTDLKYNSNEAIDSEYNANEAADNLSEYPEHSFPNFNQSRHRRQAGARDCSPSTCRLPNCYCGGKSIPGGFTPKEIPQFVLLTFDDAVNDLNKDFYAQLFNRRVNPNKCPIKATFYVSHEWTNYAQVQDLYADGHEMASHTVTHSSGSSFSEKKWASEVVGLAELMVKYAGVDPADIKGMRAPFLAVGGDKMFSVLKRYGFYYDSSMPTRSASWPYTLEHRMPHSCSVEPCPEQSHPGMWEVPMNTLFDVNGGNCAMADGCTYKEDSDEIQRIFTRNFLEHYTKQREPFPLFFHAAWFFNRPHRKQGFIRFIDSILALPDVYFVTSQELINWVRNPVPLAQVHNSPIFHCNFPNRPKKCNNRGAKCNLRHLGDERQFQTCQTQCPNKYPWVNNLNGL